MLLLKEELKRFLSKIDKKENGCWIWTGAKDGSGYGQVRLRRLYFTLLTTHRVSYRHFKGEIPKGMFVCHSCDQRDCVNPNHLFLGTHQDNMNDMVNKGRSKHLDVIGVKNPNSTLTEEDVHKIIKMLPTHSNKKIAEIFNVTHSMISCIRRGKSWTHITKFTTKTFKKYKSMKN